MARQKEGLRQANLRIPCVSQHRQRTATAL